MNQVFLSKKSPRILSMKKLAFSVLYLLLVYQAQAQENKDILQTLIDIQVKNKSLEEILNKIQNKYKIRFSYNPQSIPTEQKITLNLRKTPLEQVFDTLFKNIPVKYERIGQYIILTEDEDMIQNQDTVMVFSGRVFSQSDSLPLPLVHVYFKKDYVGAVSDYEGYFYINFKKKQEQDTLVFSMVGYQSYSTTLASIVKIPDFKFYMADSVYVLEDIAIEGKQNKIKVFFQKLRLGKRVSFMFKKLKVKVKKIFASINTPNIREKITLKLKLRKLIEELQAIVQEFKRDNDEKQIRKIMEQIDDVYTYM